MSFNYPEVINSLTPEQRLHFYELMAHNLTVAIRTIWSDDEISDADKVERFRLINEIQHRVTSKVYVLRLHFHEWTEEDTWKMIKGYLAENEGIQSGVNAAIRLSYDCARRSLIGRSERLKNSCGAKPPHNSVLN